ncbi:MAG: nucleotidyltransferase family protein [Acetobacteraceae bacterium]
MLDGMHLKTELRLLLICARVATTREEQAAIRQLLAGEIDWTLFARKAVDHGLASLAAHTLARVAPDAVPGDLLDAFHAITQETRRTNRALFDELARLIEGLANSGIEAIPFKGPVLAIQAFGDLGLREFRDLDFLVRDSDIAPTIATLRSLGYQREGQLTAAQFDLIHRLQGQEIIFGQTSGTAIEPHTRLTSLKMALDIDHAALWRRAQRTDVNGRSFLTLAPEDNFLLLAIHGGKEMWWNLKWACDIVAFIGSHPNLDWLAVTERARAQGCLRIVLLATSLAREYFNATIPDTIIAAGRADPIIEPMVRRIAEQWQVDELVYSPDNNSISMDRLRLHDGVVRRARYVARTVFLPGPHHVASVPLPGHLDIAYIPIKIAHDVIGLPLWRVYQLMLAQAERLQYAFAGSEFALAVIPASAETKLNIRRHQRAREDATRALARTPDSPVEWRRLGDALSGLKRHKKAIACYDKAIGFAPHNSIFWNRRSAALRAVGETADLPDSPLDPLDADAWAIRAGRLFSSRRFMEALDASDRALALDPGNIAAARVGIHSRLCVCDWRRREADKRRVSEEVNAGQPIIMPFYYKSLCDSEAESLVLVRHSGAGLMRPLKSLSGGERYRHDKIRVAYSSTDFRDHVVSDQIAGCFEHHDKSRFQTTAISLGPSDRSAMRRRIEAAFDRFVDARAMSDAEIASTMRELEIDIVVDLNGNSGACRTRIFAHRPAPVQVSYLGYAGTMGLPFYDYIIADEVVIPEENRVHYTEQVAYLPHSFMPSDGTRPIAARTPGRVEAGLPETGFVFACHNHEYKIGPEIFGIWMRLLKAVDGSVLWLKAVDPAATINLRREASAAGVAPERLVFAPRIPRSEDHLARLRLADLLVDTLPYNAHATACDALWAGVPVVTCPGHTFPARVAASLLRAIDMPELVAGSLAEYEATALGLARDPERLASVKAKLMRNRDTEPLFDTARFTRDLESAYTVMWERQQAGLPAMSFVVGRASAGAQQVA